jgi:hypothetical protein
MRIIGCDLHARQQTIAMLDTDTGEFVEKTLEHDGEELREAFRSIWPLLQFAMVPYLRVAQNRAQNFRHLRKRRLQCVSVKYALRRTRLYNAQKRPKEEGLQ